MNNFKAATHNPARVIGYDEGYVEHGSNTAFTHKNNLWIPIDGKRINVHPFRDDLETADFPSGVVVAGHPIRWIEDSPKVTVKVLDGEYQLPTNKFSDDEKYTYFCDDKEDAIDTAKFTFGEDVIVSFRTITNPA